MNSLNRHFWDVVRRVRGLGVAAEPTPDATVPSAPSANEVVGALRELDAIRRECRAMVTRRASLSAGASIVPIPGLDVGTDVAILLRLLPRINERFGLTPQQIEALDVDTKRVVMMFVSAVGSNLVGRFITRELVLKVLMKLGVRITTKGIVKFVPFFGQAVSASISFGAMKLLGNCHIDDCYEVARRALLDAAPPEMAKPAKWELMP